MKFSKWSTTIGNAGYISSDQVTAAVTGRRKELILKTPKFKFLDENFACRSEMVKLRTLVNPSCCQPGMGLAAARGAGA